MISDDSVLKPPISLTFYVAGDGYFSRQAKDNLDTLVTWIKETKEVDLKVIDVTRNPEAALSEGVFTTPTLIASLGDVRLRFIGDLSEHDKVITALKGN